MMDAETYLSAQKTVDEGFATGILFAGLKSDKTQNQITNFAFNRLAIQNSAAASMQKFMEIYQSTQSQTQEPTNPSSVENTPKNKTEGADQTVEIKNVEDLRAAYPEFVNQIETQVKNDATTAERNRIKGIEAIAKNIPQDLVNKAKFDDPKDAKDLAYEALQANAKLGQTYLDNTVKDNQNSGVANVQAAPVDGAVGDQGKPTNFADRFKNVAAQLDAKRRGIELK